MNTELMKAVRSLRNYTQADADGVMVLASRQAIDVVLAALRDQDAEIARLTRQRDEAFAMSKCECAQDECCANLVRWKDRAEQAEALLREALPFCDTFPDLLRDGGDELNARITAHLLENSNVP